MRLSSGPDSRATRWRTARVTLLITGALAFIGSGTYLLGSTLEGSSRPRLGGQSSINAGAGDRRDIKANNSPTVVQNPADRSNLAVVNRVDDPLFSCGLHVSFDAGATWRPSDIPFPPGEELPRRCYAPDAAFGTDGVLYVSYVTLKGAGNGPSAVWLASSRDGGRTLSPPVRVSGPLAFQVRLTADQREPRRLHLSWLQAADTATLAFPGVGYPIVASRSDDGGATWSQPVRVSSEERERVVAPSPASGPGGELLIAYLDLGEDALDYQGAHEGMGGEPYPGTWELVLARSSDDGATWEEQVVERRVVPSERFVVFLPPFPSLAVDQRRGRIYLGFQDARLGDPDAWLWVSEDGGRTFSGARRINDTPARDGTSQYLPRLSVAPGGRLDVVYYDRRADRRNLMSEVSIQSSFDAGRTFTSRLALSPRAFDSRIGFGNERDLPDLGSRLALLSTEKTALAAWADTRAGTALSRKQDLGYAVVTFTRRSPLRDPLRFAGLGITTLAVLFLAGGVRRRRVEPVGHAEPE